MEPRTTEAEVLHADQQWRPVQVLGWHRLDVARQQVITGRWTFWLVQLQLASGEKEWFEYDALNLRRRKNSS